MECYYHPGRPAVGLCKACEKGLCRDCFIEIENGGACKNKCEEKVSEIYKMMEFNKRYPRAICFEIEKIKNKQYYAFFTAVILIVLGIVNIVKGNSIALPLIIVGIMSCYYGLALKKQATKANEIWFS